MLLLFYMLSDRTESTTAGIMVSFYYNHYFVCRVTNRARNEESVTKIRKSIIKSTYFSLYSSRLESTNDRCQSGAFKKEKRTSPFERHLNVMGAMRQTGRQLKSRSDSDLWHRDAKWTINFNSFACARRNRPCESGSIAVTVVTLNKRCAKRCGII